MATHTVCSVDELPIGQHRLFKVGSISMVVYHLDDGFYATQSSCTHVFAPLAKGKIVDGEIFRPEVLRSDEDVLFGWFQPRSPAEIHFSRSLSPSPEPWALA